MNDQPNKAEFYACYNSDTFDFGPFDSVEAAKDWVIKQYLEDKADAIENEHSLDDLPKYFDIGEKIAMPVIGEQILADKHSVEALIEQFCEKVDDDYCHDEPSLPINEHNVTLLTRLMTEFTKNAEYGYTSVIDNAQTFYFKKEIK